MSLAHMCTSYIPQVRPSEVGAIRRAVAQSPMRSRGDVQKTREVPKPAICGGTSAGCLRAQKTGEIPSFAICAACVRYVWRCAKKNGARSPELCHLHDRLQCVHAKRKQRRNPVRRPDGRPPFATMRTRKSRYVRSIRLTAVFALRQPRMHTRNLNRCVPNRHGRSYLRSGAPITMRSVTRRGRRINRVRSVIASVFQLAIAMVAIFIVQLREGVKQGKNHKND